MKKILSTILVLFIAVFAFGQGSNTFHRESYDSVTNTYTIQFLTRTAKITPFSFDVNYDIEKVDFTSFEFNDERVEPTIRNTFGREGKATVFISSEKTFMMSYDDQLILTIRFTVKTKGNPCIHIKNRSQT